MKKYNESKEQERKFKGVWIEKEIWEDYDLNACEKVLLIEIDSLDNEPKHCFASNDYFAKFLGVSSRTVTRYIAHLAQRGYIYVDDKSKYKNKQYDRVIYSLKPSFVNPKNKSKGSDKMSKPLGQKSQEGLTECLNNNTGINSGNNKDLDLSLPIFDSPKREKEFNILLKQISSLYCSKKSLIKFWNEIALGGFKDPAGKDIEDMAGYLFPSLSKNPFYKSNKSIAKLPDYNKLADEINNKALLKEARKKIKRRKKEQARKPIIDENGTGYFDPFGEGLV